MLTPELNKYMKKIFISIFLLFVFILPLKAENIKILFFTSEHCKKCLSVKNEVLPKAAKKFSNVDFIEKQTDTNATNLALLYILAEDYRPREETGVPSIFTGKELLIGVDEIRNGLENKIAALDKNYVDQAYWEGAMITSAGENLDDAAAEIIQERFSTFNLVTILMYGLIDGINPCAFAVIIFFVSFLTTYRYSKRNIIYIGSAYCIAVYVTYTLIGLGLLEALYKLRNFYIITKAFYWFMIVFCLVLFVLAIYDYIKYKKHGSTEELLLQMPKSFKLYANKIIGVMLRGKNDHAPVKLFFVSLIVGFLVSLVEAVCTGQVYLPTVAFIIKNTTVHGEKVLAYAYLLLYNLMFIIPLIVVFAVTLMGYESKKLNNLLKKHLGATKILLAMVFLGLALMLIFTS